MLDRRSIRASRKLPGRHVGVVHERLNLEVARPRVRSVHSVRRTLGITVMLQPVKRLLAACSPSLTIAGP